MSKWKLKTLIPTLTLVITTSVAWASDGFDPDAAWNLLGTATVRENADWMADKEFPDELRAATSGFTVEGYVVPILAEPEMTAFILVQDPENCPFCGTGSGYGPVLEVMLDRAIPSVEEFSWIKVTGELELIEDPETFQLFRLNEARAVN
ncbi:MAG: hypothetical protein AAGI10_02895 [Pseudomonadota bacterium]